MSMEIWFLAALIPILSAAVLCYVFLRVVWAALRGLGSMLGLNPPSRPHDALQRGHDHVQTLFRGGRRVEVRTLSMGQRRICPAENCRHANVAQARFCAQCGRRLGHP